MSKIFGIILIMFSSSMVYAKAAVTADVDALMKSVDSSLDATIRCEYLVAPVGSGTGNMIGKEIGVYFRTRKIKNRYVLPLIEKAQSLKSDADATNKIVREVDLFEARLLENGTFTKCPDKTAEFFKSVKIYIEFITAK